MQSLVEISKDAAAYDQWLSTRRISSKYGDGPRTGYDKRMDAKKYARGPSRESRRLHIQDQKDFRARNRELRNKQIKARQEAIDAPHYASGELKRSGPVRRKVLKFTEKKIPRKAAKIAAAAAGAIPGAAAGTLIGGPIGGAIGGAASASAAYPAASYGLNATTFKRIYPRRMRNRYQEGVRAKIWEKDRRRAAKKVGPGASVEDVMQEANRHIDERLPGAARRRIGAMGFGAHTRGKYAAPVAIGGAVAGATAGAIKASRNRPGVGGHVLRAKHAKKIQQRKRLAATVGGSALVGGGSLAALARQRRQES